MQTVLRVIKRQRGCQCVVADKRVMASFFSVFPVASMLGRVFLYMLHVDSGINMSQQRANWLLCRCDVRYQDDLSLRGKRTADSAVRFSPGICSAADCVMFILCIACVVDVYKIRKFHCIFMSIGPM